MGRSPHPKQQPVVTTKVAICGAGFAGLALANLLRQQHEEIRKIGLLFSSFQIFDSRLDPVPDFRNDTIRVPALRRYQKRLTTFRVFDAAEEDSAILISRSRLMRALYQRVRNDVRYDCRILRVVQQRHPPQSVKDDDKLAECFAVASSLPWC